MVIHLSRISLLASVCFALAPVSPGVSAVGAHPASKSDVQLHIACAQMIVSGSEDPLRLSLRSHSELPLCLDGLGFGGTKIAHYYVTLARTSRGPGGMIKPNRDGRTRPWGWVLPGSKRLIGTTPVVGPGGSVAWLTGISLARWYDLTLPGRYRLAITTRRSLYTIGGRTTIMRGGHAATIGKHLYLPAEWGTVPRRAILQRRSFLTSNHVSLTVGAPYERLPRRALVQAGFLLHGAPGATPGLHVALIEPVTTGPGPLSVHAQFFFVGRKSVALRLTGDPFADFGRIQVTGPSYPGEYNVVKLPKPHDVPIIRKSPTPLTAYGHWLAKHPVRGLKVKTYTLKPGVVYKYAEPINLSCMYDMSLSGIYRVRVELAHTHVWSPWANVTVP